MLVIEKSMITKPWSRKDTSKLVKQTIKETSRALLTMDDVTDQEARGGIACRALLDVSPDDITYKNGFYQDCIEVRDADERLLGQLTPEHCRAICQTLRTYMDQNPNMDDGDRQDIRRIVKEFTKRTTSDIPASYLINKRMFTAVHHDSDRLRTFTRPPAPGRAVPAQVLHWMNFKNDIKHDLTMGQLKVSGITLREDDVLQHLGPFELNRTERATQTFLISKKVWSVLTDKVLTKYRMFLNPQATQTFEFEHERPSSVLLQSDLNVKMSAGRGRPDRVILVLEVKPPDLIQSPYITRIDDSHGNLVKGYYGSKYEPRVCVRPDVDPPNNLTDDQNSQRSITDKTADIQSPKGNQNIKFSLWQTVGYMVAYQTKYAVLTTAEMTWFLKLDDKGRLFVSPGVEGCGTESSTDSPTAIMMSMLVQIASEVDEGNCNLEIDTGSRFFRFLDDYWTTYPTNEETSRAEAARSGKRVIIDDIRNAWAAIQAANNNNNGNHGGGAAGGGGNGGAAGGGGGNGGAAGGGGGNGGGGGGNGGAAGAGGGGQGNQDMPNIIIRLKDTIISTGNNIFKKKSGDEGSARKDLINKLPLSGMVIGFPWELRDTHLSADGYTYSTYMTIGDVPLVLKILDEENELRADSFHREMEMYKGPLRELQGLCTPYLLYAGEFSNDRTIMVTAREGAPLANMPREALMQVFLHEEMRNALGHLHKKGILYGSINWDAFHMVVSCDTNPRVYLADYGNASVVNKMTQDAMVLFRDEREELETMINELVNPF